MMDEGLSSLLASKGANEYILQTTQQELEREREEEGENPIILGHKTIFSFGPMAWWSKE